jgi:hypothetical protein
MNSAQHSTAVFNTPYTMAREGFLSKLSGFLLHWFSLGGFDLSWSIDRHRAMCESSGAFHLLWRRAIVFVGRAVELKAD